MEWADRHDAVRAMFLTSTQAIPKATIDAWSDYDVILVVADIHPFNIDRSWLNEFGEVLVVYCTGTRSVRIATRGSNRAATSCSTRTA